MKDYELLEKQAAMMRMAEKYCMPHWRCLVQYRSSSQEWEQCIVFLDAKDLLYVGQEYRFALGVVEGKPVFEGDTLWNVPNGFSFVVTGVRPMYLGEADCFIGGATNDRFGWVQDCSWNPPKPTTVIVELPVSVVEKWANPEHYSLLSITDVQEACRKALEGLK